MLLVGEAEMIGTRQMEQPLSAADQVGAEVVMVDDPKQSPGNRGGGRLPALSECHGAAEIPEIRRPQTDWQRDATRWLVVELTKYHKAAAFGVYVTKREHQTRKARLYLRAQDVRL